MGHIASRRTISREPLINAAHRRIEAVLAIAVVILVIYLTWLPAVGPATGTTPARLSLQDCIQNILLYLPLGLLTTLALRRRRPGASWSGVLALVLAALLAGLAECIQSVVPGRVSALSDVICNVAGAGLGVLLASGIRGRGSARPAQWVAAQPLLCSCVVLAFGYALLSLVPFQLDLTPSAHSELFDADRWTAFTPSRAAALIQALPTRRDRIDMILDLSASLMCCAGLGFLTSQALQRELRFSRWSAGCLVLWCVTLMAAGLTFIQAFVHGHGLHVIQIPISMAGALSGVLLPTRPRAVLLRGAGMAAITVSGFIVARGLSPFVFDPTSESTLSWCWIPLRRVFSTSTPLLAASNLMAGAGRFLVLGAVVAHLLRERGLRRLRRRAACAVIVACVLAFAIEVVQMIVPHRSPDLTDVGVAVIAAFAGVLAAQYWHDLVRAYRSGTAPTIPLSTAGSAGISLST